MRTFRVLLCAAVTVTASTAGTVPTATATPAPTAVTTSAVFNDPKGDPARQRAVLDRIVRLVDGSPTGATVRAALFYLADGPVADALAAAARRGVRVQVVTDHRSVANVAHQRLAAATGTSRSAQSWTVECGAGRGCVGTRRLGGVAAVNHNKFFLFSHTLGADNVVLQTSSNMHGGRDGARGWNDALVVAGNKALYDNYDRYFGDLGARRANSNYHDVRKPLQAGNTRSFFYPRRERNGRPYSDPAEDTVHTLLSNIDCKGNRKVGTGDGTHRTVVRVSMTILSRGYLADRLVQLDRAGCYVDVLALYHPESRAEREAMRTLARRTANAYHGVRLRYFCGSDPVWTHQKLLLVEGGFYGRPDRTLVWTGSHNWSHNSLRQSDEAMVQIEDPALHAAYRSNFWKAAASAPHESSNTGKLAC